MKLQQLHTWNLTPTEAVALQRQLAERVDARAPLTRCELVAAADISYNRFSNVCYGTVVVLRVKDGEVIETQDAIQEVTFPYIPGLLSFRETPVVLQAFARLQSEPDAIMLDAHGYSHPRRFGLACHVGLWLDRPCLGCAKSVLVGTYREPGPRAGSQTALKDGSEVIGRVVRTRDRVKPVYVSVGHQIDLPSAVRVVRATCRGHRLPEPARQAHLHVNALRRAAGESPGPTPP
jgi:deoxyribonuclease V